MDFDVKIYDKFCNSRLSIKKKNVRFLELLFKYNGIEISHDNIIDISYNYREPNTTYEKKFKNYLLAYEYLIGSNKNDVSVDYLKKVYYLINCKELSNDIALEIQTVYYKPNKFSKIENAIRFHYFLDKIFEEEDDLFKNIFPLLFLNRELLKVNLCAFKMVDFQYNKYMKCKQNYYEDNNILPTFLLLEKIYTEEKSQPIEYLEKTINLSIKDVKKSLNEISNLLDLYGITYIVIFGSFSKSKQRLNSDIDLYINVIEDVSYIEKEKRINVVKEILFSRLNRYIDIQELCYPIITNLVNEIKSAKLLYCKGEKNE
jgi:predicted nucleotidyltransferase